MMRIKIINTRLKKNEYVEFDTGPHTVAPDRLPNDGRSKWELSAIAQIRINNAPQSTRFCVHSSLTRNGYRIRSHRSIEIATSNHADEHMATD